MLTPLEMPLPLMIPVSGFVFFGAPSALVLLVVWVSGPGNRASNSNCCSHWIELVCPYSVCPSVQQNEVNLLFKKA